jgi:hypothetical protein
MLWCSKELAEPVIVELCAGQIALHVVIRVARVIQAPSDQAATVIRCTYLGYFSVRR